MNVTAFSVSGPFRIEDFFILFLNTEVWVTNLVKNLHGEPGKEPGAECKERDPVSPWLGLYRGLCSPLRHVLKRDTRYEIRERKLVTDRSPTTSYDILISEHFVLNCNDAGIYIVVLFLCPRFAFYPFSAHLMAFGGAGVVSRIWYLDISYHVLSYAPTYTQQMRHMIDWLIDWLIDSVGPFIHSVGETIDVICCSTAIFHQSLFLPILYYREKGDINRILYCDLVFYIRLE